MAAHAIVSIGDHLVVLSVLCTTIVARALRATATVRRHRRAVLCLLLACVAFACLLRGGLALAQVLRLVHRLIVELIYG